MAWRSHGSCNATLVSSLKRNKLFKSDFVEKAMLATDRAHYAPELSSAYEDAPQSIGHSATISAPHMHCACLELLEHHLQPGKRVLDVGCGSGIVLAYFARMVGETGLAVGIDHIKPLVDLSRANLAKDGLATDTDSLKVRLGDGWQGVPELGPYDCIHVGAAAATVPEALVEQLKPEGRMIIPVGVDSQELLQIDKTADGRLFRSSLMGVRYVPLVQH